MSTFGLTWNLKSPDRNKQFISNIPRIVGACKRIGYILVTLTPIWRSHEGLDFGKWLVCILYFTDISIVTEFMFVADNQWHLTGFMQVHSHIYCHGEGEEMQEIHWHLSFKFYPTKILNYYCIPLTLPLLTTHTHTIKKRYYRYDYFNNISVQTGVGVGGGGKVVVCVWVGGHTFSSEKYCFSLIFFLFS